MRVFVCGHEFDLGVVVAQRLIRQGHKVALLISYPERIAWLRKNRIQPVLGDIPGAAVQEQLARSDAVIDVELPFTFPRKRIQVPRLRPSMLSRALEGSGKVLIVTSDAAILGDTGPIPVKEQAPLHPLSGFAWLPRLEKEILNSPRVRGVVVRPARVIHGCKPSQLGVVIGSWIKLAKRFHRGKYIGSGENRYSAVYFDDLADLYCVALNKAVARTILHAATENFSMKELAEAIHRGLGLTGEASSVSLKDARRFVPAAERLTLSHALSCDYARTLGWNPSRDSIMKEVEQIAREDAFVSRLKMPRTECKVK
jgi:nucleoside-diphosphate-sugar epimerase